MVKPCSDTEHVDQARRRVLGSWLRRSSRLLGRRSCLLQRCVTFGRRSCLLQRRLVNGLSFGQVGLSICGVAEHGVNVGAELKHSPVPAAAPCSTLVDRHRDIPQGQICVTKSEVGSSAAVVSAVAERRVRQSANIVVVPDQALL